MATDNKEVISTLNGLIEVCRDSEIGYKDAANGIENAQIKSTFEQFSAQRTRDISELQAEVRNLGDDPKKGGSLAGAVHRGWINIKAAVTGKDEKGILAEAERGEDVAKGAYEEALKKSLPANIQRLVQRQYNDVKVAHDRIKQLRNSYQSSTR